MQTVDFKFSIGQNVEIIETGVVGKVESLFINRYGVKQYSVHFRDKSDSICDYWFDEDQVSEIDNIEEKGNVPEGTGVAPQAEVGSEE